MSPEVSAPQHADQAGDEPELQQLRGDPPAARQKNERHRQCEGRGAKAVEEEHQAIADSPSEERIALEAIGDDGVPPGAEIRGGDRTEDGRDECSRQEHENWSKRSPSFRPE